MGSVFGGSVFGGSVWGLGIVRYCARFAVGAVPFAFCAYSAQFVIDRMGIPFPSIALGIGFALGVLFVIKPPLERASSKQPFLKFVNESIEWAADRLLFLMPLCFVPIGVGIVKDTKILSEAWLPLVLTIVPLSVITIIGMMRLLQMADKPHSAKKTKSAKTVKTRKPARSAS